MVQGEEFLGLTLQQVCSLIASDKLTVSTEEKVREYAHAHAHAHTSVYLLSFFFFFKNQEVTVCDCHCHLKTFKNKSKKKFQNPFNGDFVLLLARHQNL